MQKGGVCVAGFVERVFKGVTHVDGGVLCKTFVAVCGACISYLFGGWEPLLAVLVSFVVVDYLSGVLASAVEGKLNSSKGLTGIARKVFIFILVAVAHLCDVAIGQGNIVRDATIFFYLANELLSIIENSGRIGLPVPEPLKKAVEVLKSRGE